MAARKRKAAKKAVKKRPATRKKKTAARMVDRRSKAKAPTLRIRSAMPGFTVNDLQRSLGFYRDVLGFVAGEPWMDNGKMMGIEIKAGAVAFYLGQDDFKKGRDRVKGIGTRIYCATADDIDALASRIKAKGGVLDHDPMTQPWGTRDFGITDPDGYKLTIAHQPA
ncbi:MAG: VOC family protein [Gemmatimonadales bacterium]